MDRFKSRPFVVALVAAAASALGVGGVAIAQSGGGSPDKPAHEQSAPENSAADPDNVQDENGKDDAKEGDKGEKEGSEVPNDDGADGGHADEAKK
jgi:hypothetical protein